MAFTSIMPIATQTNASGQSAPVAVPAGLQRFTIRVDLATPNDFTSQTQSLFFTGEWSFDGGATWVPASGGGTAFGSTTGWGKGSPNPLGGGGIPQSPYPTHARGRYQQTGTFSFGFSIETA